VALRAESSEPTSGLEPLTCSLRVRFHGFAAIPRGFRNRLHKLCLPILRFRTSPGVHPGNWHGYCQTGVVRFHVVQLGTSLLSIPGVAPTRQGCEYP
jgi:hypothetical protein